MKIIRTDSKNEDFIRLVHLLDADLKIRDGEDHAFFAQYNKIDAIQQCVVLYEDDQAIGSGAIKMYDTGSMEVKRMYVIPEFRGRGYASIILHELESWTAELGYSRCILETGIKQPEAIRLYEKNRYQRIPNYGQYEHVASSVCFEKVIRTSFA